MILFVFFLGLLMTCVLPFDAMPTSEKDMIPLNLTMALNTTNTTAVSGYDPSFEYHNYSTVQVWMGKDKRTVGTIVGGRLYREVWHLLDKGCPWNTKHNTCHDVQPGLLTFTGRCIWRFPADIKDCTTELYDVYGKWENEKIRRLLIGAVAGALEAVTNEQARDPTNCYALAGQKACNVGDVVRVNFPNSNTGIRNYMHIRIYNWYTGFGTWQCCSGNHLQNMDRSIDGLGKEIVEQFPQWWTRPFTRDSRCIINGWKAC